MGIEQRDLRPQRGADGTAWKAGFDDGSAKGLACERCGALVPPSPTFTALHRRWHEELDAGLGRG